MIKIVRIWLVLLFVVGLLVISNGDILAATPFTRATLRYDRMKASTQSTLQITIVPASTETEDKVKLVFAGATFGTGQSATTASIPAGSIGLPGTLAVVASGTSMTIQTSDLAVGTTYSFNISVGVTTPSANVYSDVISTLTGAGVTIDTTTVASRIISDDQVVITANVPPVFTFVLSGNTDSFTTDLSSSSIVSTYGIGLSVGTNAAKGWTGWIKSVGTSLGSATTGESIGTTGTVDGATSTCQNATDCYILDVGVTSGTGTGSLSAAAEYAGNGTTSGGTFSTTYQPFATRTGKTTGDVIWFKAHVSILATKASGSDYTDTWTIVGAGNF